MSHLETLLTSGDTSVVGVWSQSRLKKKRLGRWQQSQKRPSREKQLHESKPVKQMKQNRKTILKKKPARWRWVDLVMSPTDQAGRPLWRRRTQRKTKPGQNTNGSHKTKPDQDHEETHEFKHVFLSWSRLITFIMRWCLPLTHVSHRFNTRPQFLEPFLLIQKKITLGWGRAGINWFWHSAELMGRHASGLDW